MIILLFIILFYHFLYGSLISIFIDGKSCDLCETAGFVVKVPFPRRKRGAKNNYLDIAKQKQRTACRHRRRFPPQCIAGRVAKACGKLKGGPAQMRRAAFFPIFFQLSNWLPHSLA